MKLVSVTEALSPFTDFSKVPPHRLAYAAHRGSEIHKACAAIARGLFAPELPMEWQGYVSSFRGWLKAVVSEVVFVEKKFICTCYNFVGHPDLVLRITGDKGLTVPDIKTPLTEAPTWKAQNAAYKHLVECCEAPVQRCGSLMLHPSGGMAKLIEHTHTADSDFNAFLSALTAYRYFRKGKL